MKRQLGIIILCVTTLFHACGCGTMKEVPVDDNQRSPHSVISSVLLADGKVLQFDRTEGKAGVLIHGEIIGTRAGGEVIRIPLSEIRAITYYDPQTVKTLLLIAGIALPVLALCIAARGVGDLGSFGKGWSMGSGWHW